MAEESNRLKNNNNISTFKGGLRFGKSHEEGWNISYPLARFEILSDGIRISYRFLFSHKSFFIDYTDIINIQIKNYILSRGILIIHKNANIPIYLHFGSYNAKQICSILKKKNISITTSTQSDRSFRLIFYQTISFIIFIFAMYSGFNYITDNISDIDNMKLTTLVMSMLLLAIFANLIIFKPKNIYLVHFFIGEFLLFFTIFYITYR